MLFLVVLLGTDGADSLSDSLLFGDEGLEAGLDHLALVLQLLLSSLDLEELGIAVLASADYSEKNKEIDPSKFSTDITLRLKYAAAPAAFVKAKLGEDKKTAILKLVGYGS